MPVSPNRRRVATLLALLVLGAAGGFLRKALLIEPDSLVVAEYAIPVPGWPASADGFRIAAVGDIHAGAPYIDEAKIAEVARRINAAHPDLVIWLGDYVIQGVVGGTFMEPEKVARLLSPARGRLGTFAIVGNHDRWLDTSRVQRAFEQAGIPFLRWQGAAIPVGKGTVHLYGLDDFELSPGYWPRFGAAHQQWKGLPSDEPLIVLSHNPDVFVHMPARVNLTLASHTHGGQVRLPVIGSPIVPSSFRERYARGLIVEKGRPMFVNTGIGTSIVPVRFGVPPEISILTLRSPAVARP